MVLFLPQMKSFEEFWNTMAPNEHLELSLPTAMREMLVREHIRDLGDCKKTLGDCLRGIRQHRNGWHGLHTLDERTRRRRCITALRDLLERKYSEPPRAA